MEGDQQKEKQDPRRQRGERVQLRRRNLRPQQGVEELVARHVGRVSQRLREGVQIQRRHGSLRNRISRTVPELHKDLERAEEVLRYALVDKELLRVLLGGALLQHRLDERLRSTLALGVRQDEELQTHVADPLEACRTGTHRRIEQRVRQERRGEAVGVCAREEADALVANVLEDVVDEDACLRREEGKQEVQEELGVLQSDERLRHVQETQKEREQAALHAFGRAGVNERLEQHQKWLLVTAHGHERLRDARVLRLEENQKEV